MGSNHVMCFTFLNVASCSYNYSCQKLLQLPEAVWNAIIEGPDLIFLFEGMLCFGWNAWSCFSVSVSLVFKIKSGRYASTVAPSSIVMPCWAWIHFMAVIEVDIIQQRKIIATPRTYHCRPQHNQRKSWSIQCWLCSSIPQDQSSLFNSFQPIHTPRIQPCYSEDL